MNIDIEKYVTHLGFLANNIYYYYIGGRREGRKKGKNKKKRRAEIEILSCLNIFWVNEFYFIF